MKILFLFDIGFDRPGPSVHLLKAIVKAALDNGDDVRMILRNTNGPNSDIPQELLGYKNLSYDVIKSKEVKKKNFLLRYLEEIEYSYKAARVYKKYKDTDVAFVQSTTITYFQLRNVKKLLKCPIVYNVQDIFPQNLLALGTLSSSSLIFKTMNSLQVKGYKKADKIITISPDMKNTLVQCGIDENNIEVIYNWSYEDTQLEIPKNENSFIKKFDIDISKKNVIYAGNIGRMQNVEVLLRAARILKSHSDIHFYVIGDGVYKQKLESSYADLENVTFLPFQDSSLAESIYCAASINIIPLAKGIIKTALPSKTATCLRAERNIIFCIDEDSLFAKDVTIYDGISVVDSNNEQALANAIINNSDNKSDSYQLFKKYFSKAENSNQYVKILHKVSCSD